jgi:uncharacterized protein YbjT (DUF2867 family)
MRILVTGASGFVGSMLVPRLLGAGHDVLALGREPERVRAALEREHTPGEARAAQILRGDALTGAGLAQALDGVQVAYYLIHSMESATSAGDFAARERVCANNFARAAADAGVRRIVYLGGLTGGAKKGPSRHLASRLAVEQILLAGVADSIALRASIVIGARSRSFRLLVHLVERMPVLALPSWQRFRTQPIDARDVIEMLARAADVQSTARSLDIAGPDVLTYGEMLGVIADEMLVGRPTVRLGVNLTGVTARVAAAIAGEDPELVLPLMEGLQGDLLPADDRAERLLGVRTHSYRSAVQHALGEWESSEPLAAR